MRNANACATKVIQDRLYSRKSGTEEIPSAREVLIRHHNTVEQSRHILDKSNDTKALPLCAVAFELVDISTETTFLVDLVPILNTTDSTFRLGYSRAYPCAPNAYSIRLFLNTNLSFRGIAKPPALIRSRRRKPHLFSHNIRILPISNERSPLPKLPPNIILQVAHYAVGRQESPWRFTLLSLGLVCKSWSHVVDLFFRLHDCRNRDKAPAVAVARSLESRPERGRLIRYFNPGNYVEDKVETASEAFLRKCIALLKIITLATAVAEVRLSTKIHVTVVHDFIVALSQLRMVEKCIIHGTFMENQQGFSPELSRYMRIDEVQTFIAKWSSLRDISISYWNYDDSRHV